MPIHINFTIPSWVLSFFLGALGGGAVALFGVYIGSRSFRLW